VLAVKDARANANWEYKPPQQRPFSARYRELVAEHAAIKAAISVARKELQELNAKKSRRWDWRTWLSQRWSVQ
jgi:hypothetical protein